MNHNVPDLLLWVNNFYYLPQGCLPEVHRTISLSQQDIVQYSADVSFMGAGYYNRAQSFPRLLNYFTNSQIRYQPGYKPVPNADFLFD